MKNKKIMNEVGVSVVLGIFNRKRFLKKTIENIRQELVDLSVPVEIIVIDGGSSDGTIPWLVKQKDVVSIIQHNRGMWQGEQLEKRSWGYFMNLGFQSAQGKYICMVSDDCLLIPGSLKNGYIEFERLQEKGEKIGALAFYWRNWPDCDRYFVISVNGQVYLNHGMYLRSALEDVKYINEDDYGFYCADTDLCLRLIDAGYSIHTTENALVEYCN